MANNTTAVPDLVKKMIEASVSPKMLRLLVALKSKEIAAWPETQAAQETQDLLESQSETFQQELIAFERIIGTVHYQGRILVFQKEPLNEGKKPWQLSRIEFAGTVAIPNTLGHMQSLCDSLLTLDNEPATRIAMWIHPLPTPPGLKSMTLVYLRHHEGWDTVMLYKEGSLNRLPLEGPQIGDAFEMLAPLGEPMDSGYWKRCLQTLANFANTSLRPLVDQALKEHSQLTLDDALWEKLCDAIFFQEPFLFFLMEVGRSIASRPLQESQVLLTSLVEGLTRASSLYEDRLSQAQRDHKRELKRRIADFEKLQMAYKGLLERANRQAKQLATKPPSSERTAALEVQKNSSLEKTLASWF
jgi:hypothetical protein